MTNITTAVPINVVRWKLTARVLRSIIKHYSNNKLCGKPHYMPPPLPTVRPNSSPYTPYACGAQRALLPAAVGAMNISRCTRQTDIQTTDRQTSDVRQHHCLMPPPRGAGHNKKASYCVSNHHHHHHHHYHHHHFICSKIMSKQNTGDSTMVQSVSKTYQALTVALLSLHLILIRVCMIWLNFTHHLDLDMDDNRQSPLTWSERTVNWMTLLTSLP